MGHITFRVAKPGLYFCNGMGSIHGGAIATWADIMTTMAIFAFDKKERLMSVSLNLSIDYLTAGLKDQPLYIKAIVKKLGKNICFTECVLLNERNQVIA